MANTDANAANSANLTQKQLMPQLEPVEEGRIMTKLVELVRLVKLVRWVKLISSARLQAWSLALRS